jgi:hypothetical protein
MLGVHCWTWLKPSRNAVVVFKIPTVRENHALIVPRMVMTTFSPALRANNEQIKAPILGSVLYTLNVTVLSAHARDLTHG